MRHLSRVDWIHMERLKLLSSTLYLYCPNTMVSLLLCFTSSRWVFIFSSSLPKVSSQVINLHIISYKIVKMIADAILYCYRMFRYAAWYTIFVSQHIQFRLFHSITPIPHLYSSSIAESDHLSLCCWSRPIHLCGKLHSHFIAGGVYMLLHDLVCQLHLAILLHDIVW